MSRQWLSWGGGLSTRPPILQREGSNLNCSSTTLEGRRTDPPTSWSKYLGGASSSLSPTSPTNVGQVAGTTHAAELVKLRRPMKTRRFSEADLPASERHRNRRDGRPSESG